VRAVHKYGHVLRASIASPGNDHRLGANEAPPAIISVFLGDKLSEVVQGIVTGAKGTSRQGGFVDIGVQALPKLPRDTSDRNRTSPFAFTGNKFEFRAVGSSATIARPMAYLNTIVADSVDHLANELEKRMKGGQTLQDAVKVVVQETLAAHQAVIFNGDNYTKEWHVEAERRGLPNLRNSVDAVTVLAQKDVVELFSRYGVFTEEELNARYKVMLEQYVKTINIEALLTSNLALQNILPASLRYQSELAHTVLRTREAGAAVAGAESTLKEVAELTTRLKDAADKLDKVRGEADNHHGDGLEHARFYRDRVIPVMDSVRAAADALEGVVDDGHWPLPKYREMLFLY
jgi:glutamine synthetase